MNDIEKWKKKYPKPPWVSEEVWDNYLTSIAEFGKSFVDNTIKNLEEATKEMKKKTNGIIDDLELAEEEEDD